MRLTQNNTNLVTIKKILRHSNIATTTIYAKATEKSVVEALKGMVN
jgi:integrase/recombinase XerD